MNSEAKQFLFRLLNTPSPVGFESEGQKVWMNYVGRFADDLGNDSYGNAWATLTGTESSARGMTGIDSTGAGLATAADGLEIGNWITRVALAA